MLIEASSLMASLKEFSVDGKLKSMHGVLAIQSTKVGWIGSSQQILSEYVNQLCIADFA